MSQSSLHIPVLVDYVRKILCRQERKVNRDDFLRKTFRKDFLSKIFLDLTFGAGGHSKRLLETNPHSIVYAIDRDERAIELAEKMSKEFPCELKKNSNIFEENSFV